MQQNEKEQLAIQIVRFIVGNDSGAMLHIGMTLIELATGKRKRVFKRGKRGSK